MKTIQTLSIMILGFSLMAITAPANALPPGTPSPTCDDLKANIACHDELALLCAATDAATSLKSRDRDTLVSKVLGAGTKLSQGKVDDANQKLQNYEDKLNALIDPPGGKAKISPGDADTLMERLIAARMCVDDLY